MSGVCDGNQMLKLVPQDEKWHDEELAADFDKLHLLRKDVMSALEEARQAKRLGISTNADLVLTSEDSSSGVWACVNRYCETVVINA